MVGETGSGRFRETRPPTCLFVTIASVELGTWSIGADGPFS